MTDLLRFLEIEDLRVLGRLREHGDAWIVGGWVRNGLSEDGGGDIDIATTLRPEEVLEIFPRSLDIGAKFGTIGVRLDSPYDGEKIWEVTTLRKDGGYVRYKRLYSLHSLCGYIRYIRYMRLYSPYAAIFMIFGNIH